MIWNQIGIRQLISYMHKKKLFDSRQRRNPMPEVRRFQAKLFGFEEEVLDLRSDFLSVFFIL